MAMGNTVYVSFFDNMCARQRACVRARLSAHVYLDFLGRDRRRQCACVCETQS